MNTKTKILIGILIIGVILIGGWLIYTKFFKASLKYVPGEIIVGFREEVSQEEIDAIISGMDARVIKSWPQIRAYHLKLPKNLGVEEAVRICSKNPKVEYAQPNYISHFELD